MPYADRSLQRQYVRDHYARNRETYKARARAHNVKTRNSLNVAILEYLQANPCIDCGEADPVVLEFDHRDPSTKSFDIGHRKARGYSVRSVMAEIAKCDVRCANCHRRKTYRERGLTNRTPGHVTAPGKKSVRIRPNQPRALLLFDEEAT